MENADGETEINIAVFIRSFRYVFYAFNILGLLASIFVIAVTFMVILAQKIQGIGHAQNNRCL